MSSEDVGASKPGVALAEARQAQAITQREVADALHLPLHVVDAIERGDKNGLPAHVFTRGYVRAYAKLMELDPDPLVMALSHEYGVDEPPVEETQDAPAGFSLPFTLTQTHKMAAAGVAFVLLLLFVWAIWPAGESADESGMEAVMPDSADQMPLQDEPSRPMPDTSVEEQQPVAASQAPDIPEAAPEMPLDQIRFTVREDCWIEVKRADGSLVYGDLGRAGATINLEDQGPFSILLGYAPGVDMEYNGEVIALGPHTRNNVATFVIGQ